MSETDIERVLERSHPAANLFPMMGDAELWELAEDIGRQGLEDDIILHEGLILDGRNRWVACERAGVEQRTAVWQSNGASPTAYVISKNLHRRHLTPAQRAAIAAEALPMFEAEARERRHRDTERIPDHELGEAREKAAEQFDVNPRYIQDANSPAWVSTTLACTTRAFEVLAASAAADAERLETNRARATAIAACPFDRWRLVTLLLRAASRAESFFPIRFAFAKGR